MPRLRITGDRGSLAGLTSLKIDSAVPTSVSASFTGCLAALSMTPGTALAVRPTRWAAPSTWSAIVSTATLSPLGRRSPPARGRGTAACFSWACSSKAMRAMRIAPTPSVTLWWIFWISAARPSARPSTRVNSHRGRARSKAAIAIGPAMSSTVCRSPGGGATILRRW